MAGQENQNLVEKQLKENHVLKLKCNKQIDRIIELENLLNKERERADSLEIGLQNNKQPGSDNLDQYDMKNELLGCINSLSRILKKIINNNEFIVYKNYTKNSARYCKVEKTLFDNYVDADPDIDKKSFFNYCIDFALLKADENRKYIWNDNQDNQAVRTYFISKHLVNILNGEYKYAE